jgi:hypothetical protein
VKKINREQDREFQALARALESLPPRRKASRAVQDAFSEGYESLEMDPDLLRPYDEEDDVNIAYARDYSRGGASLPGPGVSQDYYLSFNAPLADLGDGQVDTYNKTKGESGTFTRATVATCRLKLSSAEKYLSLPGIVGSYASMPHSAALNVTDLDVRAKVALVDWTPSVRQTFVARRPASPNQAFQFHIDANSGGVLTLSVWPDGITASGASSTVAVPASDGEAIWIRATRVGSTGAIKFYTSSDGVTWTQLGADRTSTAGGLPNVTAELRVGHAGAGGGELRGKVYYAEVRKGIDGERVAVFDASTADAGDTTVGDWTLNGSAYIVGYELKKVASGVPRSHYLSDGTYGGYLAEGARTNLCLRSEEFDNASWGKIDTTITADNVAAPDGTVTADLLTEGSAGTAVVSQTFTIADGSTHTFSVFIKAGNHQWATVLLFSGGTGSYRQYVDVQNGVLGALTDGSTVLAAAGANTIESWGNGWYRVSIPVTITGATALSVSTQSATADLNPTLVSGSTRYLWGAQLEAATFASSYIPTTTAAVTRNADTLTYPVAGNFSDTEGSAYAEYWRDDHSTPKSRRIIGGDTNEAGTVLFNGSSNANRAGIFDITSSVVGPNDSNTGIIKAASRWSGVTKAATSSGLTPTAGAYDGSFNITKIGIGIGTISLDGTVKNVRIWQRQMPDALLQSMTA